LLWGSPRRNKRTRFSKINIYGPSPSYNQFLVRFYVRFLSIFIGKVLFCPAHSPDAGIARFSGLLP